MILLANGPNLNLLGEGGSQLEGSTTLGEIDRMVSDTCAEYGIEVLAIQSNYEGALIDFLQEHRGEAQGVIVNPGALAPSSFALHDCLKSMACPIIVVNLVSPQALEERRRQDVVSPATAGQIAGLGPLGYYLAALWHCQQIHSIAKGQPPLNTDFPESTAFPHGDFEPPAAPQGAPTKGGSGKYQE